ncbi:MAG: GC-type dockerin domain-anchored protein [Phycisphaerales bacterium]|jgi:hypothetical protein
MMNSAFAAMLLAGAGTAAAQVGIVFELSNPEPRPGETITITMKAGFDGRDYAMSGVFVNVDIGRAQGTLSNLRLVAPMDGPGTTAGMLVGGGVEEIIAGQLNFPATAGIYADPTNPISFWAADFTVNDALSGPIVLEATTRTIRYDVYIARDLATSESRLDELVEGTVRVLVARDCAVDFDGDGRATLFDFLYFSNLFQAGDPLADFDGDGELTIFDFFEYQNQFMIGC